MNQENSPARKYYIQALDFYKENNYSDCIVALSEGFIKDVNYKPLYELAEMIYEEECDYYGNNVKKLFTAVRQNPRSRQACMNLGNYFYSSGNYRYATPFFEKAREISPDNRDSLLLLSKCYSKSFQPAKALEILKLNDESDFEIQYYRQLLKILNGNTDGVNEIIEKLSHQVQANKDDPDSNMKIYMLYYLERVYVRFLALENIEEHIRAWQFILYGSVVLQTNENEDLPNGGRYTVVMASYKAVKLILNRLKMLIETLQIPVKKVASIQSRNAEILGRAIAALLKVDFQFYDEGDFSNTLIVADEKFELGEGEDLFHVQNGNFIFTAWHKWTTEGDLCPDIIGCMAQEYYYPWEGGNMIMKDAERGIIDTTEEDHRNTELISKDILNAPDLPVMEDEWLKFYSNYKKYLTGIGDESSIVRSHFEMDSPVQSSYFY